MVRSSIILFVNGWGGGDVDVGNGEGGRGKGGC